MELTVERQSLDAALLRLSKLSGRNILFAQSAVGGKQSTAVVRAATFESALSTLLTGTELVFKLAPDGSATILPRPAPPPPSSGRKPAQRPSAAADVGGDVEAVVVAGRTRLSQSPQAARQEAHGIVDAIGSVEIAKLTDQTVAETLTRIPGVSFARGFQTSKAWYATIRGFDGRYNSVSLDGGMLWDTTRNQRSVYLDTVPSSAINEIEVHKTVTPDMDPNALGGHISMKTLRAFDLGGAPLFKATASYEPQGGKYAPYGDTASYSAAAVAKRTFGPDDSFGFVGAASMSQGANTEEYNNTTSYVLANGVSVPSGSLQRGLFDRRDESVSLLAKLEMRGADRFYGFLSSSYFKGKVDSDLHRSSIAVTPANVTNATASTGSFTGATAEAYSNVYQLDREVITATVGGEYRLTERSKLVGSASILRSNHDEYFWQGARFNLGGLSGTYNISETSPDVALNPDARLSDAANWVQPAGARSTQTFFPMTDDVYTVRADYRFNNFTFSRGLGFQTGFYLRRLDRTLDQTAYNYTLPAGTVFNLTSGLIPGNRGEALTGTNPVYTDREGYWAAVKARGVLSTDTAPTTDYHLVENVYAGHAAVYYTTSRLRALAGLRYEATRFDDETAINQRGVISPRSIERFYNYLLPNVQASYELSDTLRIRAAYTQTIARPDFQNFAQGLAVNINSKGNTVLTGANPDLKSRLSNNYDLSTEMYLSDGYITLSAFHKDVANEIFSVARDVFDANGVLLQTVSTPFNAGSAKMSGLEAAIEWRDFTAISPLLQGVGVTANLTYLKGVWHVVLSDGTPRTMPGLSQQPKLMANLILFYDRGPLSASLAFQHRGRALGGVGASTAADNWIAARDTLDTKVSYRVSGHIDLFAEGKNLTNAWFIEQTGVDQHRLSTAVRKGASYALGVRLKY